MALRHAVLAALLDEELSGYQLAKAFDMGVANFWHALPQQLYAELAKLEKEGLVAGREVVQDTRPNKRLFQVTGAGLAELERFARTAARPSVIRDDLLVMVQAADHLDTGAVVAQFGALLRRMRGDRSEEEFLRHGERIGPYLTCRRGLDFEQANHDWCTGTAAILRERAAAQGPQEPQGQARR
jgi:DNA-binding PadR family transcriptional regulator